MTKMKEMTLEERKVTLLNIMDCIDSFCSKKDLRYYLTGGSLLGAIRHKGFIPWDDDIDIAMPRKDYEVFSESFNAEKFDNYIYISEKNISKYYLPYGKVIDKRTLLVENVANPVEMGINVDVFPIDFLGDDFEFAKRMNRRIGKYRNRLKSTLLRFGKSRSLSRSIAKNIIAALSRVFSREKLIKKITKLSKKFVNQTGSKYVAIIVMMTYGEKEIMERKWFDGVVKVDFEGRTYNAPANYHEVLTHFYKDYMQLPPVEKRISHHSNKAWWRE